MTQYLQSRFTVPVGHRTPDQCAHGWTTAKGECVFCGTICPTTNTVPTRRFGAHLLVESRRD